MGNTQSKGAAQKMLDGYREQSKSSKGIVLSDAAQNTFLLREYTYASQSQHGLEMRRFQGEVGNPKENTLNVVKFTSKEFSNICSTNYKLYALYEYPQVTLTDEIHAMSAQGKHFEQPQLWSILQSCVNSLQPSLILHPNYIHICPDGQIKTIHPDMLEDTPRLQITKGVYYAPEKLRHFGKNEVETGLRKEAIFSMGMTVLHAAHTQSLEEVYDYAAECLRQDQLESAIEKVAERYSCQFVEMLANVLQPNPNRRTSVMEVQAMLNKYWDSLQTEQQQHSSPNSLRNSPPQQLQQNTSYRIDSSDAFNHLHSSNRQNLQHNYKILPKQQQHKIVNTHNVLQDKNQYITNNNHFQSSVKQKENFVGNKKYTETFETKQKNTSKKFQIDGIKQSMVLHKLPIVQSVNQSEQKPFEARYSYGQSEARYSCSQNYNNSLYNNDNIFTDPKLLDMIRKDLAEISKIKIQASNKKSELQEISQSRMHSQKVNGIKTIYKIDSNNNHNNANNISINYTNKANNMNNVYPTHNSSNIPQSFQQDSKFPTPFTKTQSLFSSIKKVQKESRDQSQFINDPFEMHIDNKQHFERGNNLIFVNEIQASGNRYEGMTLNGIKHGTGKLIYEDGAYFEGQFRAGRINGNGILYYRNGKAAYEGEWYEDQFQGKGILYNENPISFKGGFNFKDFNDVEDFWLRYEGQFQADNKQGEGKLILANGEQLQGHFYQDCIDGLGVFTDCQGHQIKGLWENNVLITYQQS